MRLLDVGGEKSQYGQTNSVFSVCYAADHGIKWCNRAALKKNFRDENAHNVRLLKLVAAVISTTRRLVLLHLHHYTKAAVVDWSFTRY